MEKWHPQSNPSATLQFSKPKGNRQLQPDHRDNSTPILMVTEKTSRNKTVERCEMLMINYVTFLRDTSGDLNK